MRKTETWIYLFALLVVALFSGCSKESDSIDEGISEQEAIAAALKLASQAHPEISGSQVTPSNIQAEQMILGEATKRISENNSVARGYSPDMLVWIVTMDGLWLSEFPRPTDLPTPEPYQHFIIILDAKSGLEIQIAVRP